MSRIFTVITIISSLLAPLFILRCDCAVLSRNPANEQPKGYTLASKSKVESKGEFEDVITVLGNGRNKAWAEIIGVLTVVQSEPLPSLYTFVINEYEGNDDDDDDKSFVRQSACFQEAEKTGYLTSYRTPCIDTTEELGRRSGDMSFTEFIKFQNRVRVILWQEKNRKEMLNGGIGLKTTIAPLKRTMYLTYPNLSEGIDLVVVAESNGINSTGIRIASDRKNRDVARVVPRQQLFIRDYRKDGDGFPIEPYVPLYQL